MPEDNARQDEWAKVREFTRSLHADPTFRQAFQSDPAGTITSAGFPQPFRASVAPGDASQRTQVDPQWCFTIGDVTICVTPWW